MATPSTITGQMDGATPPVQDTPGRVVPKEFGDPDKQQDQGLGPNNEKLAEQSPELVAALRQLVMDFRMEGIIGRRHEIRRIKQSRLFWQGLQYLTGWNADSMDWQMPFGQGHGLSMDVDKDAAEGGRYQFVTNFYQAFGLSFVAVVSQDVPSIVWYPQSPQSEQDIATAKAASDVAKLVEQNNCVEKLLAEIGYLLWTDGVLGAYVRYVVDGQKFGFHDSPEMGLQEQPMGEDAFACPNCGQETPAGQMFSGTVCPQCGTALSQENFQEAPKIKVPVVTQINKVANGQEVISIFGGLEINRPIYINDPVNEGGYIQLQHEVHEAKLRATYPHVKDRIRPGSGGDAEDQYARASRTSVNQGLPTTHPGDSLFSLITFSRTWLEPWVFHSEKVKDDVSKQLLKLFPDGCYVAFAGETYCESRNESKRDHWRILQPLPGDGQNRPAVGSSLISVQERYNILSNIVQENAEYSIPPMYADPQVLDFDALGDQVAEPGVTYPARARAGQPLAAGFFQPEAGKIAAETMALMQELSGATAQFLTGVMPAIFGGTQPGSDTLGEYAMAREQALGRLGLYYRGLKYFWAEVAKLAVDCFRKNRAEDVEMPVLGEDGEYESKMIHLADLKGNLQARPEADETFPRLKSQQRSIIQQMLTGAESNPVLGQIFAEPANLEEVKRDLGLKDIVIPGEDSRTKQLKEITQLLQGQPIAQLVPGPDGQPMPQISSTVPVDELDRHEVEFQECVRWANSQAGQTAKIQNPMGFANVKAHAREHKQALMANQQTQQKPPSASINFKDLPIDGKVQLAAQDGLKLDPGLLAVNEMQERNDKAEQAKAKNKEKAA